MSNPVDKKQDIPFMRTRGYFVFLSVLYILVALYFMAVKGFNFGVDFKGGIKLVYEFSEPTSDGSLREKLESLHLGEIQVVRFGSASANSFLIKVKHQEGRELASEITLQLTSSFGADRVKLLSEESVGPKVGAELRTRGLWAMVITWFLILIYIGFRFDFLFAPGAVVALIHDVIVPLGFFSFFHKEINLPILAAFLTIIGYSINDTIVIYDRIRENLKKLPSSMPLPDIIDRSLTETLSRTIVTSLTVFFAMGILFYLGGAVLHDFAFCMLMGVVSGTYSTIFMASPVYLLLHRLFPGTGMSRGGKRS